MAQSAEQTEGEGTISSDPSFPQFLPGYYRETVRFYNFGGVLPPEVTADPGQEFELPPQTKNYCGGPGLARRGDPPWRGALGAGTDCQVVAASLEGTTGRGEIRCLDSQVGGTFTYAGEFHPASARFTLRGSIQHKRADGPTTFDIDVELARVAENCPADGSAGAQ